MKKSLVMLGVAVAALSSCTQNEVINVNDSRTIGFDTFVSKPSRTIINSVSDLKSFNVFGGYSSLTNNFDDVVVTEKDGSWGYTDLQYWEASKTYTFQAYAGATANAEPTANGVSFTSFTADGQSDLLSADVVSVTTNESAVPQDLTSGKVSFDFRHVLSMIKFTFTSTLSSNVSITISNLTINGLNSVGTYTTSASNKGTWGTLGTAKNYVFTTDGSFTSDSEKVSSENIVIPQTVNANAIEVTFDLEATGGLTISPAVEHKVELPAITWEEGKRYNYTVELTAKNINPSGGLSMIEFGEPTVDEWENALTVDEELPGYEAQP